jgi:hypothetical protein
MQQVDTGWPVAGVDRFGVVVTVGTSGVEQVPPGEDAVEGVWVMFLPTIVRVGTRTKSSGALITVLVERGASRSWGCNRKPLARAPQRHHMLDVLVLHVLVPLAMLGLHLEFWTFWTLVVILETLALAAALLFYLAKLFDVLFEHINFYAAPALESQRVLQRHEAIAFVLRRTRPAAVGRAPA